VVLVVVELGRGRNVEDVVLDTNRARGQAAGAAALCAANRPGASRFTAPPSKSRQ
jgi:allantoicase